MERNLRRAGRSWHGLRRRDEADLPTRRPGTVRVFEVAGRHIVEEPGAASDAAVLLQAGSVAVVDLRPRTLVVEVLLRPPVGANRCLLRVGFRARVVDAATVARLRVTSLFPELDAFINQSQRLRWLVTDTSLEHLDEAYFRIHQRLLAQCHAHPPDVPGMQIRLVSVHVTIA
ncbi:hypothetical protein LADH09A_003096 [Micromonospora sp. LAH09]|uniref:hypothetical protein n=1 Tax=Micromonospora cabrerizensis TaxID=2911213 RepID=UPI001EE7B75D|nr:hypothetical protein [Micromonospora cabrerizensis]MCG5469188.1 hypothetical protein [Micromonospora cabrerizensis]